MQNILTKIEVIENGLIPVKYEYCDVMYDTKINKYIAVIKIKEHKIAFKESED